MDVDRIYQLMGSAVKRLYGYYIKRPLQRYNVDIRADKVLEKQKTIPKVAPRHEGTDHLFRQISQSNPQLKKELAEKHEDLLKRLGAMKVVSKEREISEQEIKEMEEMREKVKSRLPKDRLGTEIPIHAYIEPHHVPVGRISLIRALDFIGKHSKTPEEYDTNTIAVQHRLNEEDVKNVLEYFKPFYRDEITEPVEDASSALGLPKQHFDQILTALKPKSQLVREQIETSTEAKSKDIEGKGETSEAINK